MAGWGDLLNSAERVDKLITNRPAPPQPSASGEESRTSSDEEQTAPVSANDDDHFIQNDDYFTQKHALDNNAWMYVELAKMVTPPSAETKREGEFMKLKDGQNYWTKYYWKTRIASKNELKLGMHVIAFNDNHRDDLYRAPEKKSAARGGTWFYAKITDMSDMFRGFVTVSGNYKVGLKNLRVIIK
jgi:hypothetical protein